MNDVLKKPKHEQGVLECPKCGQTDFEITELGVCKYSSVIEQIDVHGRLLGWRDTQEYDYETYHFECGKCGATFGAEDLADANWI